jgi:hypothetical protein
MSRGQRGLRRRLLLRHVRLMLARLRAGLLLVLLRRVRGPAIGLVLLRGSLALRPVLRGELRGEL